VIRKAQRCAQGEMMPETCGMIRDDLALIINLKLSAAWKIVREANTVEDYRYRSLPSFFVFLSKKIHAAAFQREGAEGRQRGDKAIPGADTRAAAARTQSVSCKCVH
jgi:hypothetical protein